MRNPPTLGIYKIVYIRRERDGAGRFKTVVTDQYGRSLATNKKGMP
jgi:hypothetical protein